jgi:hypothetical protein
MLMPLGQNIIGWEIVTGDGAVRNIDAAEEPDLAVALRGSGSQFGTSLSSLRGTCRALINRIGIVTQFTIKTYPMGDVWGGMRIYSGDQADDIYAALHNFVAENENDQKAAVILTDITAVAGLKLFLIFYYYGEPEPPTTGAFAQFLDIDSTLDTTKTQTYAELVSLLRHLLCMFNREVSNMPCRSSSLMEKEPRFCKLEYHSE